jgi:uncharacterized protein YkwD
MRTALLLLPLLAPVLRPGPVALGPLGPARASSRQDDDPAARRARQAEAMAVLKARDATPAEQEEAVDALLDLGQEATLLAGRYLDRQLDRHRKDNQRAQEALLKGFGKAAKGIVAARLDREGQARLEASRAAVLGAARSQDLSKETIRTVSDPAVAALEELLVVRPAQVWDADEELFEAFVELLDAFEVEGRVHGWWSRAVQALREGGSPRAAERLGEHADPRAFEERLMAGLRQAAEAATPLTSKDLANLEFNASVAEELDPEEVAGIADLNHLRILLGLGVQRIDVKLCEAGRDHSKDMATLGFFAHESPVEGKTTPWMRAERFGTTAGSENIAAGQATGPAAIRAWWYSPGHHKNMLGGGARTGLGRHGSHWTQLFGG